MAESNLSISPVKPYNRVPITTLLWAAMKRKKSRDYGNPPTPIMIGSFHLNQYKVYEMLRLQTVDKSRL